MPAPANGLTYFYASGTRRIDVDYSLHGTPFLAAVLRHEIWHAVTGEAGHSSDPSCVSYSPAPSIFIACGSEASEMIAATEAGLARVSFPDDPTALADAAWWWNWSCNEYVMEVE